MKYLYSPSFTVGAVSDAYHDNYDAVFRQPNAAIEELASGGGAKAATVGALLADLYYQPEPRTGCSWCDDSGELGPQDDRFSCVCPAARVRELEGRIAALITKASE